MNFNRKHKKQEPSLTLFEKLFAPMIEQSRNIIIRYQPPARDPGINHENDMGSCSVNGCMTPDEFRKKLTAMIEESLFGVLQSLECTYNSYWQPQLEHIRFKVTEFRDNIGDNTMVVNDGYSEYVRHYQYKCFKNFRTEGFKEDYSHKCSQSINLKIEKFTEVWLEVISSVLSQLNLMSNLLLKSELDNPPSPADDASKTSNFKIRLNFNVSEVGCFFRLLARTSVIVIPFRHSPELLEWITENIQSKNCDNIQPTSMHNKFFTYEAASLLALKTIFQKIIKIIDDEIERLSR
jgi:hypothetical protein